MTPLYFNEFDAYPARWLANLWPDAAVDTRSIADVQPDDVTGIRAHFFGGIGGWELALDLAEWPADREVWTGSCPCQPFSAAGKGRGQDDPRHLWPAWFRLIRECRPGTVFGEQVESAVGHGWLDGVFADLEGEGYACGAVVLGAHSVGAPHIRQRIYWVAHRTGAGRGRARGDIETDGRTASKLGRLRAAGGWLAVASGSGPQERGGQDAQRPHTPAGRDGAGGNPRLADAAGDDERRARESEPGNGRRELSIGGHSPDGGLADTDRVTGRQGGQDAGRRGTGGHALEGAGPSSDGLSTPWADSVLVPCADGKQRSIGAGLRPLAHGVPARASKLRAYGNAIVPQVAAVFVRAFMDCDPEP